MIQVRFSITFFQLKLVIFLSYLYVNRICVIWQSTNLKYHLFSEERRVGKQNHLELQDIQEEPVKWYQPMFLLISSFISLFPSFLFSSSAVTQLKHLQRTLQASNVKKIEGSVFKFDIWIA